MKTFGDLQFIHTSPKKKRAEMYFANGYGVSVINYGYKTKDLPYEVAVLYNGEITYNTPITDNVIGWLNGRGVTKIMKAVQKLN